MAIVPGSRVGVYEVTSQLGEGAMGVVFRARDTKLLRDVALKVLPDHFANDADRLSRLQREAQVLASLNHPNIAHVYGLEQVGGSECIVMEFVEGETLEDLLKKGPVPVHDALDIARQLVDGLAAAHERGIVHRDLKPANIKLASKGAVKILDFGLAKPVAGTAVGSSMSVMPTIASGSSMAGGIFGTIAYMSPEQARGKDVDARTDIWAFGCVLYEMLTGRLAFGGETATDTIATIVTGQADLQALPPDVPASIRLLLSATLQKNVQQRLQHIGDARLFLDQAFAPASSSSAAVAARPRSAAGVIAAAFAAGLAIATAAVALYMRPRPQPAATAMRFELVLPNFSAAPSVSPDGQHITYVGAAPGENAALWLRSIGSETAEKLAGTDKPTAGAWSPDGHFLAVISDGKLKKIDLTTRSVQVLRDIPEQTRGMSWSRSGVILLSWKNELYQVPADGGMPTKVMALDASRKEQLHALPAFLPDGNHFVFAIGSLEREKGGIFVGSLDGKTKSYLMPLGGRLNTLQYVSGYVMIGGDDLIAQPFDDKKLALSGSPVPIVDGLGSFGAASDTGVLVFQKVAAAPPNKQLTWFDRNGRPLSQLGMPANYGNVEISPTGDRVAVDITAEGNADVWVIDVARAVPSRLTFEPARDWTPVWSADGSQIIFASGRAGTHIYQRAASGVGSDRLVFKSDSGEIPVSWSHDGRYIVFSRIHANGAGVDTWLLTLGGGEPKATPFIESPFDKAQARISPDGRWITYATNDSGMYQIIVQSFPDPNGGRWQITAQGGIEPKWKRDGRELYYLALDGKLMAVPVNAGATFQAGSPSVLFQTPLLLNRGQSPRDRRYDVAPDGRFLIAVPTSTAPTQTPVTAVVNWTALLNR